MCEIFVILIVEKRERERKDVCRYNTTTGPVRLDLVFFLHFHQALADSQISIFGGGG